MRGARERVSVLLSFWCCEGVAAECGLFGRRRGVGRSGGCGDGSAESEDESTRSYSHTRTRPRTDPHTHYSSPPHART